MKKIAIVYFSGAGSTKKVAGIIYDSLNAKCTVDMRPIERADHLQLHDYAGLVVGTPVYHAAPARLIIDYFSKLRLLPEAKPHRSPAPAFDGSPGP